MVRTARNHGVCHSECHWLLRLGYAVSPHLQVITKLEVDRIPSNLPGPDLVAELRGVNAFKDSQNAEVDIEGPNERASPER